MIWLVIVSRLQEGLVPSPTQARAEQSSYSHPAATLLCGSLILVTAPVPAAAVRGRAFWPSHGPTECCPAVVFDARFDAKPRAIAGYAGAMCARVNRKCSSQTQAGARKGILDKLTGRLQNGCSASFLVEGGFDSHAPPPHFELRRQQPQLFGVVCKCRKLSAELFDAAQLLSTCTNIAYRLPVIAPDMRYLGRALTRGSVAIDRQPSEPCSHVHLVGHGAADWLRITAGHAFAPLLPQTMASSARTLRADPQRNRDKLLSAATEAFAAEGEGVALETVAPRAGVGIGTLYRHFPSREALVVAAYQHEVDALCPAAADLVAAHPADQALREWTERFADYIATKCSMGSALRAGRRERFPVVRPDARADPGRATPASGSGRKLWHPPHRSGTQRVMRVINGIWYLPAGPQWRADVGRMLDLVVDGLRYGVPDRGLQLTRESPAQSPRPRS